MTTRDQAPVGAPCWVDLWTSDVDGSRAFYSAVFGWEAAEPSEEFGGYFMFLRDGVPVAGGMGDMGDTPEMKANNTWKVYLATDDIDKVVARAEAEGAQITVPPMPVADLGQQTVMIDPTGAAVGAWQAGTFPGFTVLDEHASPSWFELHTREHAQALAFYRSVWGWEIDSIGDTDEFRYATVRNPAGEGEVAGVMDSSSFLPEGQPAHWRTYWEVDDVAATVAAVRAAGGSVESEAEQTPYGILAGVADPSGAPFGLRTSPT